MGLLVLLFVEIAQVGRIQGLLVPIHRALAQHARKALFLRREVPAERVVVLWGAIQTPRARRVKPVL